MSWQLCQASNLIFQREILSYPTSALFTQPALSNNWFSFALLLLTVPGLLVTTKLYLVIFR